MKIALAQLDATVGDLRGNGARILDFYRRGTAAGADLVMTPEMAITGYPPRDLLAKHRFVDDNLRVLEELAAQVDGELVVARGAYANAVAARDSQALHKVSGAFAGLGANLYAAEASVEAAAVLRRGGHSREAAADENRAAQLLSRCEGAATPVARTITARSRLTPGELDAAVQAAAGRSNKQIAADSHVSVRTVENHLQRVYEKLGISSRRELADALRDQPGI